MGRLWTAGGVVLALGLVAGCGAVSHGLSGTVTYAGKPLASGSLTFEPTGGGTDDRRPAASAPIKDGKYSLAAGKGVGTGAYLVRIYPPPLGSGMEVTADTINFPPYEVKVELTGQSSVQDFQVPEAQKK